MSSHIPENSEASQEQNEPEAAAVSHAQSQMRIKRSVSPDGRIDSLSVEIGFPLTQASLSVIKQRATQALKVQHEIVSSFLQDADSEPRPRSTKEKATYGQSTQEGGGTSRAMLLDIGSMEGKWGRRFFVNVEIEGKRSRLFGTQKQLVKHLKTAGLPIPVDAIVEGVEIRKPCRAITKPSSDGRYLNVEALLPAA